MHWKMGHHLTFRRGGCSVQLVLLRLPLIERHDAAETQVVSAGARLALAARAHHVSRAILVGA